MADFKGFEGPRTTPDGVKHAEELQASELQPLFEKFDMQTHGGLVMDQNGQVHEIYHPTWVHNGQDSVAARASALPIYVQEDGSLSYQPKYAFTNGRNPSLGSEKEWDIRANGRPHNITEDGTTLKYPDGTEESRASNNLQLQPEGFKGSIEYGTDVAFGWQNFRRAALEKAVQFEAWLEKRGLQSASLSMLTEKLQQEDVTENTFVLKIDEPGKMRSLREFGCLSEQVLALLKSYPAARHALMRYQAQQVVFSLAGAAAPMRDGNLETTLLQHYHDNFTVKGSNAPVLPTDDLSRYMAAQVAERQDFRPYDWRELSRALGSPSSGAIAEVPPESLTEYLQEGDQKLRDGSIISINRNMGWHADRLRLDFGAIEICNIPSTANLYRGDALREVASKYIVAAQLEYLRGDVDPTTADAQYQRSLEVGHINNFFMAISGKETNYIAPDQTEVGRATCSAKEMAQKLIDFTNTYCPEPITAAAQKELLAALDTPPPIELFNTPEEVFAEFFKRNSSFNTTEALRYARQLAGPEVTDDELLTRFAEFRHAHVVRVAHEEGIPYNTGA